MEDHVAKEIEKAIAKREQEASNSTSGRKTRAQKKTSCAPGTASANQVASALGKRLQPTQQAVKSWLMPKKQPTNCNMQPRTALGGGRKRLFESGCSNDEESASDDSNDTDVIDGLSDEEQPCASTNDACCEHCKMLRKAYSQSGTLFVKALATFGSSSASAGVLYADLLPIPENVPKCELSGGSNVYIKGTDKNAIKSDGE
ncbi:hypothetical protein ONE63_005154 [Megalurothrips usitatus]|uniref:Uncharacterized protein n=1 Tax=Megalurothrips usitatus TaxID=439358 RepID=A0AAV7XYF5_9NEOP|nr:hypothetical protein ONE63_005154 [Megalurothrips usitatus]